VKCCCFVGAGAALGIVENRLRGGFAYLNLGADLLDLRRLLFHSCDESLNFLLLLRVARKILA